MTSSVQPLSDLAILILTPQTRELIIKTAEPWMGILQDGGNFIRQNLKGIADRFEEKRSTRMADQVEEPRPLPNEVRIAFAENAWKAGNEKLQEMWAELLFKLENGAIQYDFSITCMHILSQLQPHDIEHFQNMAESTMPRMMMPRDFPIPESTLSIIDDNLIRLGLLNIDLQEQVSSFISRMAREAKLAESRGKSLNIPDLGRPYLQLTRLGREFYKACATDS